VRCGKEKHDFEVIKTTYFHHNRAAYTGQKWVKCRKCGYETDRYF
jgi:adenine-specific DNA methylase